MEIIALIYREYFVKKNILIQQTKIAKFDFKVFFFFLRKNGRQKLSRVVFFFFLLEEFLTCFLTSWGILLYIID